MKSCGVPVQEPTQEDRSEEKPLASEMTQHGHSGEQLHSPEGDVSTGERISQAVRTPEEEQPSVEDSMDKVAVIDSQNGDEGRFLCFCFTKLFQIWGIARLALYEPFGVDVPLNLYITHLTSKLIFDRIARCASAQNQGNKIKKCACVVLCGGGGGITV